MAVVYICDMNSHVADNMSYTLYVDCFNSQWLQLHCYAGGIGKEVARAAAHGLSGGVFSVLGGGSFGSGAASGAIASGVGSFVQSAAMGPGMMIATSAAIGGVAAWATGGDFLKGALMGLKIGLFNHGMHDYAPVQTAYRVNDADNLAADLPEVECVAVHDSADSLIALGLHINSNIDYIGTSLEKYSGNSTVGSNGSFYFHGKGERGFYGNQYVKTFKLQYIGKCITKVTVVGKAIDAYNTYEVVNTDYQNHQATGIPNYHNTAKASGKFVGGWAGAETGIYIGAKAGAIVGSWFGGAGAIPGSIIGGIIGGIFGGYYGKNWGEQGMDYLYKLNYE